MSVDGVINPITFDLKQYNSSQAFYFIGTSQNETD